MWLRSYRWRRPNWKDQVGLEPEQRIQTWIQALEGGTGEPKEAYHQMPRLAGIKNTLFATPAVITHFLMWFFVTKLKFRISRGGLKFTNYSLYFAPKITIFWLNWGWKGILPSTFPPQKKFDNEKRLFVVYHLLQLIQDNRA